MGEKRNWLRAGTVLAGRYRLERVMGEGGFGITYEAADEKTRQRVAVKELYDKTLLYRNGGQSDEVILSSQEDARCFEGEKEQFLREADILRTLAEEPGIIRGLDFFEANETAYLVMEYADGRPLKEWIEEHGPMEAGEVFARMLPLVRTLGKVHKAGIIHRDISPENILVLKDGSLKLLDFGAAEPYQDRERTYQVIVKGGYAPAEQYQAHGIQGPWTDVYALCGTMYTCMTGFTPEDALSRILDDELQPPSKCRPGIGEETDDVVMKGLQPEAEERFQSMEALEEAMLRCLRGKNEQRGFQRSRRGAGIVFLLAAAVLAGGIWYLLSSGNGMKSSETDTAILVPAEAMDEEEAARAGEILEDRIRLLAGEGNYRIQEEDGAYTVTTPKEVFEGKELLNCYECYIARPMDWMVYQLGERDTAVQLEREDIAQVQVLSEGEEEEEFFYLKISVKPDKEAQLEAVIEGGGQPVLGLDVDLNGKYYYITVSQGEEAGSFYAYGEDDEQRFMEVIKYNLEQPGCAVPFDVYCEPTVLWEETEEAAYPGEYQQDENAFDGETVILEYEYGDAGAMSEGEWYAAMMNLKMRLDCLGIPYAFGRGEVSRENIAVKTYAEDMNAFLAELLCMSSGVLRLSDSWGSFLSLGIGNIADFAISEEEDGSFQVCLQTDEYWAEQSREMLMQRMQEGEDALFLSAGVWPLASCQLDEACLDGIFTFDTLTFRDEETMGEEYRFLFDLVQCMVMDSDMEAYYDLERTVFLDEEGMIDADGRLVWPENWMKGPDWEGYGDILDSLDSSAEVYYQCRMWEKDLYCFLDLDVSDDLPEKALAAVKELYEAFNLDSGACDDILFILTEEEGEERARIWFWKQTGERKMTVGYAMQGGRIEQFQEELLSLMEEDPFFRSHMESEEPSEELPEEPSTGSTP